MTGEKCAAADDLEHDELEEDVRDFCRRFAQLVIERGFRSDGRGSETGGQSSLDGLIQEAQARLKAAQTEAELLQEDAKEVCCSVYPTLRENARHMQALYMAIDRLNDHVVPTIEANIAKMERAMCELEEMRKAQADASSDAHGSFGLGSPWGAVFWSPKTAAEMQGIPEVFDTCGLFDEVEPTAPL